MATLLDWFGKTIKDTEKNIGHFVDDTSRNVGNFVNSVTHPAPAPQTPQRPQNRPLAVNTQTNTRPFSQPTAPVVNSPLVRPPQAPQIQQQSPLQGQPQIQAPQPADLNMQQQQLAQQLQAKNQAIVRPAPVSGISAETWGKMRPDVQQRLINADQQTKQAQSNVWNPGAIVNDVQQGFVKPLVTSVVNTAKLPGDLIAGGIVNMTGNDAQKTAAGAQIQEHFNNSIPGGIYRPLDTIGNVNAAIIYDALHPDSRLSNGQGMVGDVNYGNTNEIANKYNAINAQTAHTGITTDISNAEAARKVAGAYAETGLNLATLGAPVAGQVAKQAGVQSGKIITQKVINQAVQDIAKTNGVSFAEQALKNAVALNGTPGALSGVASTMQMDNPTLNDYATNALTGFAGGAVAGAVMPFAAKAAESGLIKGAKTAQELVDQYQNLSPEVRQKFEEGFILNPFADAHKSAEQKSGIIKTNVLNDNEAYTLADYADIAMKRYDAPNDVRNQVVAQARNAAKTAGFDITNMTPREADTTIRNYLAARDQYKQTYDQSKAKIMQGGFAKNPFADANQRIYTESSRVTPNGTLHQFMMPDKSSGMDVMEYPDRFQIVNANIRDESLRGKGIGTQMYKDIIEKAREAGKPIVSDATVETPAVRVWEKLKREGYNVVRDPQAQEIEGGGALFVDLKKPVYTLNLSKKASDVAESQATRVKQLVDEYKTSTKSGQSEYAYAAEQQLQKLGYDANGSLLQTTARQSKAQQTPAEPAQPLPSTKVPAETVPSQVPELDGGLPYSHNTPIDSKAYLKEQVAAQEAARKAGSKQLVTKLKDDISVKLIDSLAPIENTLKRAIKDGADIKISDANHITPQLDRVLRADTIAGQYIKDKGLAKVIQDAPDVKALDQYLIAKHAADLEKAGIKTGRNLEADKQLLKDLAPTYEAHAKQVIKYNRELLDKAVEYGLVSKQLATRLKKQYPNYVPANRIFGEGEKSAPKGSGSGKASRSTQTAVQKIKGSTREIESPLSSIMAKTQDVIKQGETNRAAAILASYKDLPGNPFNLREMKPSETVGAKSTIAFMDKGRVRRFETTPEIEAAAKSLNKEQIGILGKIVRVPTRLLRLGATGVNVGFTMANIAKDLVGAAINSKHPLKSSVFNPAVVKKAATASLNHGSKEYGEMLREAAGGTTFDIARDAPVENVAKVRAGKNAGTKALYTVTHPGELLRAVENTIGRSEEFTRGLQYFGNKQAALDMKLSEAEAARYGAHAARHNSVNFARAGEYGAVLNSALPYLNAGIQGARTFTRTLKERPVQTITKVAILSTIPAMTTTAWNLSDPKRKEAYDDIADYEKEGNIIIVPENPVKDEKTGKWNVIKIPVSQEVANLNNIARNALEAAHGDGSIDAKKVLADLIGTFTSVNVTSGRELIGQVTPQAIKPAVETVTNQNLFTGNKIVPDSMKNLPASEQYGERTSGTAKVLGKLLNASPNVIDNGLRTTFGGAGQNVIHATDSALAATGVIKPEEIQGKDLGSSVTGRFYGASAKPASDTVEEKFKLASNIVMKTPEYQNASQDDKKKMLNRLRNDIQAVEYNKSDTAKGVDPKNKLTTKQQALKDGSRSANDYTDLSKTTSTKASSPKEKYDVALKDYNAKKKDMTDVQRYKKEKELAVLKVKSNFKQDVVELWGMSKADIYNLLTKDKDGQRKAEELIKLDQALYNAGLTKYLTFKNGIAPASKTSRGGTKRASTGRKSSGRVAKGTKGRKSTAGSQTAFSPVTSAYKSTMKLKTPKVTAFKGKSAPKSKGFTAPKLANYTVDKTKKMPTKKSLVA